MEAVTLVVHLTPRNTL